MEVSNIIHSTQERYIDYRSIVLPNWTIPLYFQTVSMKRIKFWCPAGAASRLAFFVLQKFLGSHAPPKGSYVFLCTLFCFHHIFTTGASFDLGCSNRHLNMLYSKYTAYSPAWSSSLQGSSLGAWETMEAEHPPGPNDRLLRVEKWSRRRQRARGEKITCGRDSLRSDGGSGGRIAANEPTLRQLPHCTLYICTWKDVWFPAIRHLRGGIFTRRGLPIAPSLVCVFVFWRVGFGDWAFKTKTGTLSTLSLNVEYHIK